MPRSCTCPTSCITPCSVPRKQVTHGAAGCHPALGTGRLAAVLCRVGLPGAGMRVVVDNARVPSRGSRSCQTCSLQLLMSDYFLGRSLALALNNFPFLSSRCTREVAVVGQGEQYCQVRPGSAPGLAHGFRPPHIPLCPLSDGRHCQPRGLVHAADDAARKGGAAAAALLHGVQRLAVGERSASVCCASEHALSRPLRVPLCLPHCWRLTAARRSVCRCCCRGC